MVLFSEDHIQETRRRGRIEVICGSMFSGKTEELIRRMKRAKFAKQRVEIFKPAIDTRYSEEDVVSHDSHSIASTPIDSSASILLFTSEIDVVGIDEAQFFDSGLIDVCNQLANNGIRVIIAGLDMDFKGNPFGPMPQLCAIADETVVKEEEPKSAVLGESLKLSAGLRHAISLNDSFRFSRELFGGDTDLMNRVIEQISVMSSYKTAVAFLSSKVELNEEKEAVNDFLELLKKYFNQSV